MSDTYETEALEAPEAPAPPVPSIEDEPKIMCYVSKRMVPKSQTIEVEYASGRKVWVLARYVHYNLDEN